MSQHESTKQLELCQRKGNRVELRTYLSWNHDMLGYNVEPGEGFRRSVNLVWCKICARYKEVILSTLRGVSRDVAMGFLAGTTSVTKHQCLRHFEGRGHQIAVELENSLPPEERLDLSKTVQTSRPLEDFDGETTPGEETNVKVEYDTDGHAVPQPETLSPSKPWSHAAAVKLIVAWQLEEFMCENRLAPCHLEGELLRREALKRIQDSLKSQNNLHAEIEEIESRMTALRNYYAAISDKLKFAKENPSVQSTEILRAKWPYILQLQFLRRYDHTLIAYPVTPPPKPKKSSKNVESPVAAAATTPLNNRTYTDLDMPPLSTNQQEGNEGASVAKRRRVSSPDDTLNLPLTDLNYERENDTQNEDSRVEAEKEKESNAQNEGSKAENENSKAKNKLSSEEKGDNLFCEMLATKLKAMKAGAKKEYLKLEIHGMIIKAEFENEEQTFTNLMPKTT